MAAIVFPKITLISSIVVSVSSTVSCNRAAHITSRSVTPASSVNMFATP